MTGTALFSRSGTFPRAAQCPWQACDKAAPVGRGERRAEPTVSLVLPRAAPVSAPASAPAGLGKHGDCRFR